MKRNIVFILTLLALLAATARFFGGGENQGQAAEAERCVSPAATPLPFTRARVSRPRGAQAPSSGSDSQRSTADDSSENAIRPLTIDEGRRFKRHRMAEFEPPLKEIAKEFQAGNPVSLSLPLFEGEETVILIDAFTPYGEDSGVLSGKMEGDEGGFVTLAFSGDAESGTIRSRVHKALYTIEPADNRSVLIGEVDEAPMRGAQPR